jgi:iron complex transport system substrate-binding protein
MMAFRFKCIIFFCFCFSACKDHTGSIENSYFKHDGSEIIYASRFLLEKIDGYKKLTILNPWQGAANVSYSFYLVPRDSENPAGIDTALIITVPIRRIISMSTTYISMISALGAGGSIVGISGSDLVYDYTIKKKVKEGIIADVGYEDNLNNELIYKLSPDLLMVYGVGDESAGYLNKIRDLGIKVLYNADYLEADPLGKAEWIKLFGALYCRDKEADEIFSALVDEYNDLRDSISSTITDRPRVLLGMPWKDTWYISPGNSFISSLIYDAGGEYLWNKTISDYSMPYGVENVWTKARYADYWLNISTVNHKNEILAIDYRLGDLPVFIEGNLYNNNNRTTGSGGNDYWESGSLHPQIILKDIAAILHPDLFPGYNLYYYKKITE